MNKQEYNQIANKNKPENYVLRHCIRAFFIGGGIGALAQGLLMFYQNAMNMEEKVAISMMSVTFIFIACVLTGLGVYDNLAMYSGAGLFIPITGFANSVCASALEGKSEGLILGIGSNMFKLAGSVITYGIVSATVLGVIRYAVSVLW